MALSILERFAGRADVPVYLAVGENGLPRAEALSLRAGLRPVASPRAAAILVVAGTPRPEDRHDLARLHDQTGRPRATLWWGALRSFDHGSFVDGEADPLPALRGLWTELVSKQREDEPDLLPDVPPNPWRGIGPNGQGGKGMMGGTPYGRPMAMTDADPRDGLELDAYTAEFGPFLPMFPPGLVLNLTLQGDIIAKAEVARPAMPQPEAAWSGRAMAARVVALLGLSAAAARLRAGGMPALRAAGALGALSGLAPDAEGRDLRERLGRWLEAPDAPVTELPSAPLPALLHGLEWQEAMLTINSFAPPRLTGQATETAAESAA